MKGKCARLLLLSGLAGLFSHASSQTWVGIQGGLSVPSLGGGSNELSEGYTSRLAPNFGVTLQHRLSDRFSLEPAIMFDGQGGQRNGLQPITSSSLPPQPGGGYYYADFNNTAVLNYIEMPILVRYALSGKQTRVHVSAGPYAGYLLNASQKTSGTSLIYLDKNRTPLMIPVPPDYTQLAQAPPQSFDATTDIKDSIHRINAGITAGIGLDIPLSESRSITLNVEGLYGLTNIQRYPEDGTNRTGNLLISVGYAFAVGGGQ